jgi:hypothetical protein
MKPTLTKGGMALIHRSVEALFDYIKAMVLGPGYVRSRSDKNIFIEHRPEFSIPGLYRQAAAEEGTRPTETHLNAMVQIAASYLDAERERTKAQVTKAVTTWLADPKAKTDVHTALGGELSDVFAKMTSSVERIVDTESTTARNMGTLEGISKIAGAANEDDPTVFFITVRDNSLCEECRRLHLIGEKPRVWKLSEISNGYHKRGDSTPSIGGLHPHCRCTLTYLSKGYGFDAGGRIKYIEPGHDEYAAQRG